MVSIHRPLAYETSALPLSYLVVKESVPDSLKYRSQLQWNLECGITLQRRLCRRQLELTRQHKNKFSDHGQVKRKSFLKKKSAIWQTQMLRLSPRTSKRRLQRLLTRLRSRYACLVVCVVCLRHPTLHCRRRAIADG